MGINCSSPNKKLKIHLQIKISDNKKKNLFDFRKNLENLPTKDYHIKKSMDILINSKKEEIYFSKKYTKKRKIGFFIDLEKKFIEPKLNFENKEKLWKVLKSQERLQLIQKDVFRVGEIKFELITINNKIKKFVLSVTEEIKEFSEMLGFELNCRICLEGKIVKNPFINFCNCCYNMPIHIFCLQKWLFVKCLKKKDDFLYEYDKEKLCCDICKKKYPSEIKYKKKIIKLFKIGLKNEKKIENYILLSKKNMKNKILAYYFLYFSSKKSKFSIGRSKNNDICLKDLSVSQQHCDIIIQNKNKFYIKDNFSKYGTLICFKKPFFGHEIRNLVLQYNKMVFDVHFYNGKKCEVCYKKFCYFPTKIEFLDEEVIFGIFEVKEILRMKTFNNLKKIENKEKKFLKSKSKNFFDFKKKKKNEEKNVFSFKTKKGNVNFNNSLVRKVFRNFKMKKMEKLGILKKS